MRRDKQMVFRLLTLALAAVMLLCFTACGGPDVSDPSDVGGSGGGDVSNATSDVGADSTTTTTTGEGDVTPSSGDSSGDSSTTTTTSNGGGTTKPVTGNGKDVVVNKGSYKVHSGTYPVVTDGSLTLTVMVPGDELMDFSKQGFATEYEKKTGIKVKYKAYNSFDSFVVKASVMQSDNQPDIFISPSLIFTTAELEDYEKQGVILDLAPYLETWGPNITKMVKSYPISKNFAYQSNGKVYSLPGIYPEQDSKVQEYQLMINEEWLYELGLDIPKTTEDFYKVLKAFKTQDPNGNGKLDEEGFGIALWAAQLWNPWGLNMSYYIRGTIDEKGNVENGTMTNQFREGIRYWKKLYDENLINKSAIGASNAALFAQFKKCGVVAYPYITEFASESDWENWTAISWPKAPASEAGNYLAGVSQTNSGAKKDGTTSHANLAFVFKSTKAPEAAVRWLDYFYTDDGSMLWNYGPVGTTYTKIGDKYKLVKNADKLKLDKYSGVNFGLYTTNKLIARNTSEMSAQEKFYNATFTQAKKVNLIPNYSFYTIDQMVNKSERAELDKLIVGDLQWGIDAIQGKVNVETDWNAYINKYSADYSKWKSIYQKVYNRVYG